MNGTPETNMARILLCPAEKYANVLNPIPARIKTVPPIFSFIQAMTTLISKITTKVTSRVVSRSHTIFFSIMTSMDRANAQ